VLATDVTQRADLEQLVAAAVERFGRLDVLVSNAGIARTGLVADLDVDAWEAMINVNVRGGGCCTGSRRRFRCSGARGTAIS